MSRPGALPLLFFCIGIFILGILAAAYGIGQPETVLLIGLCTVAFVYFQKKTTPPDLPDQVPGTTDAGENKEGAVPGNVSWWNRETPIVSEEQMQAGIYMVCDKGYVQAAVLLSFIMPGLGQTYNGQYLKGGVLCIAGLALVWVVGLWALVIWLIGTADAYLTARKVVSGDLKKPTSGMAVFIHMPAGLLFMLGWAHLLYWLVR
jgi:TM2 domain-containing membrane protein YozV